MTCQKKVNQKSNNKALVTNIGVRLQKSFSLGSEEGTGATSMEKVIQKK